MTVVVLGFFSPSTELCKELLHYPSGDPKRNFIEANEEHMYRHLLSYFSPVGSVILDMTGLKGMLLFTLKIYFDC